MTTLRTLAPLGLGLALLLAGCSGGTTSTPAGGTPTPAPSASSRGGGVAGAAAGGGAVSGKIAYVSGSLMQVQDTSIQTAVAWTASTTVSSDVSGTLADVVTGVCVTATSTPAAGAAGANG
jgi:hypothetical protein